MQLQLSIYLSIYISVYLFVFLFIYLSIYLTIYLSICLSIYLQIWNRSYSARLPTIFEIDNIKNAAILRDFLNFWTWQRQKRSFSARLPQFFKLTTSKAKQFSETSFNDGKLSAELTASYQCVLQFFSKVLRLRKSEARSYEKCCTCHAKSS